LKKISFEKNKNKGNKNKSFGKIMKKYDSFENNKKKKNKQNTEKEKYTF
jgi:hypothetical protein